MGRTILDELSEEMMERLRRSPIVFFPRKRSRNSSTSDGQSVTQKSQTEQRDTSTQSEKDSQE